VIYCFRGQLHELAGVSVVECESLRNQANREREIVLQTYAWSRRLYPQFLFPQLHVIKNDTNQSHELVNANKELVVVVTQFDVDNCTMSTEGSCSDTSLCCPYQKALLYSILSETSFVSSITVVNSNLARHVKSMCSTEYRGSLRDSVSLPHRSAAAIHPYSRFARHMPRACWVSFRTADA
jgi:hypothetical protein